MIGLLKGVKRGKGGKECFIYGNSSYRKSKLDAYIFITLQDTRNITRKMERKL